MRHAFTLLEMLVTILIILTLISLLTPAIGKIKNKSKEIKCQSNQRQLWLETVDYARDHTEPSTDMASSELKCPSLNLGYSMSGWQDFGRLSLKGGGNHNGYLFRDDNLDVLWSDSFSAHRKPKNMGVSFNGKVIFY